jgi:hypothetical protein
MVKLRPYVTHITPRSDKSARPLNQVRLAMTRKPKFRPRSRVSQDSLTLLMRLRGILSLSRVVPLLRMRNLIATMTKKRRSRKSYKRSISFNSSINAKPSVIKTDRLSGASENSKIKSF